MKLQTPRVLLAIFLTPWLASCSIPRVVPQGRVVEIRVYPAESRPAAGGGPIDVLSELKSPAKPSRLPADPAVTISSGDSIAIVVSAIANSSRILFPSGKMRDAAFKGFRLLIDDRSVATWWGYNPDLGLIFEETPNSMRPTLYRCTEPDRVKLNKLFR